MSGWEPMAALERFIVPPTATGEDRQRRLYLSLLIAVFVPAAVAFTWVAFDSGSAVVGWADVGLVVSLLGALAVVRWAADIRQGYRLVTVAVISLMGVVLHEGGGSGFAFLWWYAIPPAAFYVFGSREGFFWFAFSLAEAGVMLITGLGADYPSAAAVRFVITYAIAGALSLGLQRSRERLFAQLSEEKEELKRALDEVDTLSDMIPMCAWCRNVRDDAGYWSRIEEYLARRAGTVVTHGICPACAATLAEEGGAGMGPAYLDPDRGPTIL